MPKLFVSQRGVEAGAPQEPLVLFGHLGEPEKGAIAQMISESSTLSVVQIPDLDALRGYLAQNDAAGILAHSRTSAKGEAADAIRLFREMQPAHRFAIYHAWDYNVERGARRARECGADGVMMPAIDANEMFSLLFGVLQRVAAGARPPSTVEEHERLLMQLAPSSPFWKLQDTIESEYY